MPSIWCASVKQSEPQWLATCNGKCDILKLFTVPSTEVLDNQSILENVNMN